jgi:chemotaxis protein MotB
MSSNGSDDSGVAVYPPLPIPKGNQQRDSAAQIHKRSSGRGASAIALLAAVVVGGAAGWAARTYGVPDGRIAELNDQLTTERAATASARAHSDELQGDLDHEQDLRKKAEAAATDALSAKNQLADKAADLETKAKAAESDEAKLRAAVDKSQGSVTSEGDEIHLQLVDKVLFKLGDDQLTDKGKALLDKVAVPLNALADKQIWVQGHTDDSPIVIPPAPKPKKGAPVVPVEPRFKTNWELSAARALQVVHYLQDQAKIDPRRLAALAFGQYRPVSLANKALNRRIEIVLVPKKQIIAK